MHYILLRSQDCSITSFAWALRLQDKKSLGTCRLWGRKLRNLLTDDGKLVAANTGDCDGSKFGIVEPENSITSAQSFARVTPQKAKAR